jgi:hypothetical protein
VLAEDLHRALVQVVRLGQVGRALVALDDQVVDAGIGEKDRRRQAAAAATDDQHGNL